MLHKSGIKQFIDYDTAVEICGSKGETEKTFARKTSTVLLITGAYLVRMGRPTDYEFFLSGTQEEIDQTLQMLKSGQSDLRICSHPSLNVRPKTTVGTNYRHS